MEKKTRLLSVTYIVSTFNRAVYLDRTLNNISEFITPKDELIIVDGGSSDETAKVVSKYKQIVSTFISEKDLGQANALNKGMLIASRELIKTISDDDYILPRAMRQSVRYLSKHDEVEALICGGEAFRTDSDGVNYFLYSEQVPKGMKIGESYNTILEYVPCELGLLFRRSLLPRVGIFDTTLKSVDIGFLSKLVTHHCKIIYLDICLYKHFQYSHSTELQSNMINLDRAKVFINRMDFDSALTCDTGSLVSAFGLTQSRVNRGFVWMLKASNAIRKTKLGMVFILHDSLFSTLRNFLLRKPEIKAKPALKWSGRAW